MHRPVQPLPEWEVTPSQSHPDRLPLQNVRSSTDPCRYTSLVEIWVDEDPAPLPRPTAASVDRAHPVAASVDVGRTCLPYASVDTRRPGPAAVGPRLLEPATSVFAGAPTVAAHPGSLDVASSRTHVRSVTPMPLSDVGQRMRVDVPRPLDLTLRHCLLVLT